MNGETALWYVRSRYTSNDFDRNRRQQEVLMAIFKRFASFDVITKAPELYEGYRNTVESNLDLQTIITLIPVVPFLSEPGNITQYYITQALTTNYITESGAMVLIPNQAAINQLIQDVIYNP
jgi:anionic cell wall polymer biosynthesis LytR-Cps2A-Psr (LCP) family protein